MSWWYTPDVTGWAKSANEPAGLRTKHWVTDPTGTMWLRKEPRSSRPTELAIEALTLELARRCGYPVAYGTCCTWVVNDVTYRGFISRKFHDEQEAQTSGGALIANTIQLPDDLTPQKAEKHRRIHATLAAARYALEEQEQRYGGDLLGAFVRMLVFDAWIGNGDRHSANWAILVRSELHGSACRLAPVYDTAACLFASLQDSTLEQRYPPEGDEEELLQHIAGCPSGFGDGDKVPGIPQSTVLETIRTWPEWQLYAPGLISFFVNNLSMVDSVLDEVPDDWLSPRRRRLIRRLLVARVKMLQEVKP